MDHATQNYFRRKNLQKCRLGLTQIGLLCVDPSWIESQEECRKLIFYFFLNWFPTVNVFGRVNEPESLFMKWILRRRPSNRNFFDGHIQVLQDLRDAHIIVIMTPFHQSLLRKTVDEILCKNIFVKSHRRDSERNGQRALVHHHSCPDASKRFKQTFLGKK